MTITIDYTTASEAFVALVLRSDQLNCEAEVHLGNHLDPRSTPAEAAEAALLEKVCRRGATKASQAADVLADALDGEEPF